MKYCINILFVALLTMSVQTPGQAQSSTYTFTIHLGAFMDARITDFDEIRSFGYIYSSKLNNLNQIYMGDYSSEAKAMPVLSTLKDKGYIDAFITRRRLDLRQPVSVIQIGSERVSTAIDWSKYTSAGPLQVYQDGEVVRIVTGPFQDLDEAQSRTNQLRRGAYADAFIKNVNSVLLHRVTNFETGSSVQIPTAYEKIVIPDNPKEEVVIAEITPKKRPIPDVMVKKGASNNVDPKEQAIPKTYDDAAPSRITVPANTTTAKGLADTKIVTMPAPRKTTKVEGLAAPSIRPKVKRTSVLRLQEVLKGKGAYKSSLDGFYGNGTKKAFAAIMANDQGIQKYKLLTELYQKEKAQSTSLQRVIYMLDEDVSLAVGKLKAERSALADAYQAYGIFVIAGKNGETDRLMNKAIQLSFGNKKSKLKSPVDLAQKYTYADYDQLIQHLLYVHSVATEKVSVPCWLFNQHPKAAYTAFNLSNDFASDDYAIQDCGNITAWESIQLMETVLKDMTPDLSKIDKKAIARLQSRRAQILLQSKAQNIQRYKAIDQWNTNLWKSLAEWEANDPLHARIATPLKITYFQSWALLEDHFMNQGLQPKEARGLGLEVLQSIVEPYLGAYTK